VRPASSDELPDRAAIAFNEAINRRDIDALGALMTDRHTFVDSEGMVVAGKEDVLSAWTGFFEAFPDYRNDWSRVIRMGDRLIAVGRSTCSTQPALDGPALWTVSTAGDKVSEWRVYEDTPANREQLGISEEIG
jgi:ketosteroid isomerase-like protein